MEECLICCKAVRRGAPNTFCIGDMPFWLILPLSLALILTSGQTATATLKEISQ
ncbi:hypothetical protein [Acetomicrobium sp. S15 = DSM 107314]|uniref:hypothetical protein n=1 Tax=Acetomicrobium sp. S15 = DSM 107314 TaxID=2529858 RepID=UPI00406BF17F